MLNSKGADSGCLQQSTQAKIANLPLGKSLWRILRTGGDGP